VLVMGGNQDTLTDAVGTRVLTEYFGVQAHIVEGSGHDVMLDNEWAQFAERLCTFVKQEC
jgi:pimeloyl-ACP methyl ester carboxylesterase